MLRSGKLLKNFHLIPTLGGGSTMSGVGEVETRNTPCGKREPLLMGNTGNSYNDVRYDLESERKE